MFSLYNFSIYGSYSLHSKNYFSDHAFRHPTVLLIFLFMYYYVCYRERYQNVTVFAEFVISLYTSVSFCFKYFEVLLLDYYIFKMSILSWWTFFFSFWNVFLLTFWYSFLWKCLLYLILLYPLQLSCVSLSACIYILISLYFNNLF